MEKAKIVYANTTLAEAAHAAEKAGTETRRWRREDGTEILLVGDKRLLVAYDGKVHERKEVSGSKAIFTYVEEMLGRAKKPAPGVASTPLLAEAGTGAE